MLPVLNTIWKRQLRYRFGLVRVFVRSCAERLALAVLLAQVLQAALKLALRTAPALAIADGGPPRLQDISEKTGGRAAKPRPHPLTPP